MAVCCSPWGWRHFSDGEGVPEPSAFCGHVATTVTSVCIADSGSLSLASALVALRKAVPMLSHSSDTGSSQFPDQGSSADSPVPEGGVVPPELPVGVSASADGGALAGVLSDGTQDGGGRAPSGGAHRRRPRSRRRVVALALGSVLAVVLVLAGVTAGVGLWLTHRLSSGIETIADPFAALPTRAAPAPTQEGEQSPVNILVLGSDSRISAGDPSAWKAGAQRTDAMMIMQISGDREHVTVMSIPRDSWVPVPGHGKAKINAAFSFGGPTLTIQTVEQLTGVHIDHFVIADFTSFSAMTDELGGVSLNLKNAQTLDGEQFSAGPQRLNGAQALAYVRERYSLPGGDFDRVKRQQAWMRAIVHQLYEDDVLHDPARLYSFLEVASSSVAADEGFDLGAMRSLATSMRNVGSNIMFFTAPVSGTGTSDDGQSIVLLDEAADAPVFKAMAQGRVAQFLADHPDAVQTLPAVVN